MKRILVTGATGNIGREVIHFLSEPPRDFTVIAAVRSIEKAKQQLATYPELEYSEFDFETEATFNAAFKNIDILFLLRPPQISDVNAVFKPLLQAAKSQNISNIIFLSVQGVESSKVIPHHKIEMLIKAFNFNYIFVRPSYFMQNLITTLSPEIQATNSITLPSGDAKFNWVDVKNIGEAVACFAKSFEEYANQAFDITGTENKSFPEVISKINSLTNQGLKFISVNPFRFYFKKRKAGLPKDYAIVMTLLHTLPRFQKAPQRSDTYFKLTGKQPTLLSDFIKRERAQFVNF
ncbi:NmrA family NAD(P)-binding protein [Formosa haliotis]|uniref:NmrA family NAD(P)-binding protein n=1 Tax=Formosa haliotis TaxID=1555194 RepID=UPI0008246827|nr:NmrA family NAD(P)-binding protein [Formosa haliotis]